MWTENDVRFMQRCLLLAATALGDTSPNPMVGAVIVRRGRIIGEGWHHAAGQPHAEIEAIRDAAGDVAGSTLYVSLEPCCFTGRTPPCTEAIVQHKVARVVVATTDPNPRVAGKGIEILRQAGIRVDCGLLENEARRLNEAFFYWIRTGLPFTTLKCAMSLDGKIATDTGVSKWISCTDARTDAHLLRKGADSVAVGIETVLADDPELTVRLVQPPKQQPVRIIFDRNLRIPLHAGVVRSCSPGAGKTPLRTWVVTTGNAPRYKRTALEALGVEVIPVPDRAGIRLPLPEAFAVLEQRGIASILVEGGPTLAARLVQDALVNKVVYYIAPKLIGGATAPGPLGGRSVATPDVAWQLTRTSFEWTGHTMRIEGYLKEEV